MNALMYITYNMLAQCFGPECCTAAEVLQHQSTGPCHNIAGEVQPCLTSDSNCTECMNGLTPPIPPGQNFQMSCTGTPSELPVNFHPSCAVHAVQIACAHTSGNISSWCVSPSSCACSQAAESCTGTSPYNEDCEIWAEGGGLIKPMCIPDMVSGSTCVPTHSGACAEYGISSADCDAHEGCTWSDGACTTTAAFESCMGTVGNGREACENAGFAPGHCTFRTFQDSEAGRACMTSYLNGDEWAGTEPGTCPPYAALSGT